MRYPSKYYRQFPLCTVGYSHAAGPLRRGPKPTDSVAPIKDDDGVSASPSRNRAPSGVSSSSTTAPTIDEHAGAIHGGTFSRALLTGYL